MKKQNKLLMWLQKVLSVWPLDQLVYYVDLEPQHARQGWPWQHPISTMLLRVKYVALKCKYFIASMSIFLPNFHQGSNFHVSI